MFDWTRNQTSKRGFPPGTQKRIHIVVDGEKCLKDGLSKLFPSATFALDIRPEGRKTLETWRCFSSRSSF
jgi:hypothetical protein